MSRKRQKTESTDGPGCTPENRTVPSSEPAAKRRWLFRLAAMIIAPVFAFACLEGVLLLLGFGYSTRFCLHRTAPDGREVVIENEKFGWPFFGPALARVPFPMAFSAEKPANTYRIFVFGESAAYGDPLPEFGLCRMLEAQLGLRYPGTRFEVINAAMTAINSHVIVPMAHDCARENGDLWVIYMGNNEVVGPFGSGTIFGKQAPPLPVVHASIALKRTRTGQLVETAMSKGAQSRDEQPEWGGMTMFLKNQVRRDDPKMERVYAHFADNLREIISAGASRGTKVIVSTIACNLADCAPFGSMHRSDLNDAQRADWERLFKTGVDAENSGILTEALAAYMGATKIDDQYAELRYRMGRCYLTLRRDDDARTEFSMARDFDTLRFRADSRLNDIIRQAAGGREKEGVLLADSERDLARRSPHEICGKDFLYEHVHLNFQGNYWLAKSIANKVAAVLPEAIKRNAAADWPSIDDCALRLAWTDWNLNEAGRDILMRISDPPFSTQINHDQQVRELRAGLDETSRPDVLRQSLTAYKLAVRSVTNDWELQSNFGRLARKLGDLETASEAWRKLNAILPLHPAYHYQLGQLLNHRNLPKEAAEEFQAALNLKSDFAEAIVGLGMSLSRQGKADEAIEQYQKALKIKPHSMEAHLNLAAMLEQKGRSAEAKDHYRRAVERKPLNADALVTLGQVCVGQGWTDKAIDDFATAVRIDPGNGHAHFYLAGVLSILGRSQEAFQHFQEAIRYSPDLAEAHLGLGIELGKQGKHAEAAEEFAQAVRLSPKLLEARLNLGTALSNIGHREEALQEFRQALRLDPKNAIAQAGVERLGK